MTEMQLISQSKKLYEQILGIEFAPEEMLAFGRAVFTKTPWGALSAAGKLAMFRLTAAFALADPAVPAPAETLRRPPPRCQTNRAKEPSPTRAPRTDRPRHNSRDVA